jgi:hypothetical protein
MLRHRLSVVVHFVRYSFTHSFIMWLAGFFHFITFDLYTIRFNDEVKFVYYYLLRLYHSFSAESLPTIGYLLLKKAYH